MTPHSVLEVECHMAAAFDSLAFGCSSFGVDCGVEGLSIHDSVQRSPDRINIEPNHFLYNTKRS